MKSIALGGGMDAVDLVEARIAAHPPEEERVWLPLLLCHRLVQPLEFAAAVAVTVVDRSRMPAMSTRAPDDCKCETIWSRFVRVAGRSWPRRASLIPSSTITMSGRSRNAE